ncbi:uncharacterized protein LOC106663975 [Cimex lectularius]|uniref:Transmembrane protein 72 n=1 Tax=Cimex lectularius TaxID=79782 RepID=A0A8I6RG84_CIMLE|nr:uncharacterized protein LOC106663975 [Cimex lectularius]
MFTTGVYGVCEEELTNYGEKSSRLWTLILPIIRFYGIFTSVVFCGVGIDIALHKHNIGVFYIICSMVVFFFEITWVITLFLQMCLVDELHPCFQCWEKVLWFRLWKKSILYSLFAFILFVKPKNVWLSLMAGILLLFLAVLYLLLTYRSRNQFRMVPSPRLLRTHSSNRHSPFDKYEDMTEMMDDIITRPMSSNRLADLDNGTLLEM